MKLFILKALIALALLILAFEHMPQANAQEDVQQGELQVEGQPKTDSAITDSLQDDEAPPPEAPYPGAKKEEGFNPPPKIDRTESTHVAPQNQSMTLEKPLSKDSDGTYNYGVKESDKSAAMSVKGGMFGAPKIQNTKNQTFFDQVYEAENFPTIFIDYEWQLKTFIGELSAKLGSGIFYAQGRGYFADPSRKSEVPPESFSFIMFPTTVGAIYRLDIFHNQPFIPYIEGGGGYFTFMEFADDSRAPKFAGAPVAYFAAGGAFLLDWLDRKAIRELDNEYGINHVYLTAEYKEFVGLDKQRYDFTSRVIGGGIMMDF